MQIHCGFVPLILFHKKASSGPVSRVLCARSFDLACLSFIYSASHLAALAFYPPSLPKHRAGSPQTTVYANLQPPAGTAQWSPTGWWSLTPPSHPYSHKGAVVLFCLSLPSPTASTFGSGEPYAARTFLSRISPPATDRTTAYGRQS